MLYKTLAVTAAALACAFVLASSAWACTTTLITKGASADGSVIVTHSDDNELRDQRIVHVPAMDHKPGDKRPVYTTGDEYYPRIVSQQRGPAYDLVGYPETKVLGYIEQVPHTYAYIDGNWLGSLQNVPAPATLRLIVAGCTARFDDLVVYGVERVPGG